MPITAGARLGSYEILSPLGAGGMGEVYRARDGKLGRDVAIKVLPQRLASDADALARFEREAKAVAALSHPNILSIFDFGSDGSLVYAVMELLEGETLRDRLSSGALSARKAVDYAIQIANGLAAAHEKGIVHRDVKPDNLFVTRDDRVKILDFGLAKATAAAADSSETRSPTVSGYTEPGTVMGTVGYMSPEQVKGLAVDSRSDIFSFGAVLYEMLAGRRSFQRDTAAETMTAILKEEPPELSESAKNISSALDRIVKHCLEKRPEHRFQSARDLAFDLQSISTISAGPAGVTIPPTSRSKRRLLFAAAGTLGLMLAWALGRWTAGRGEPPRPAATGGRFTMLTDRPGVERSPSLSPDGKSFVYVSDAAGKDDIYFQRVGGRNTTNLTKDSPAADYAPAFSPDGEKIAFRSERDGGGIYVMGATGESVRRLTDFGFDPAWSPGGGEIVVATEPIKDPTSRATESALWVVDVATGKKHLVFEKDGVEPRWSPHGTRIAFWGIPRQNSPNQGQRDIATVASDGSQAKTAVAVTNDPAFDWSPEWSPDGRFLYFASDRGGTMNLWRVAIEESSGRVLGEPEPVTTPSTWVSHFRFSRDASALVFAALDERSTVFHAVFDPAAETIAGSPAPVLKGSRLISTLELSPDGKWIVFDSPRGQREDLFLVRSDGSDYRQLIDEPFQHRVPRWSPDGSRISFYSNRSGKPAVWAVRPDGSGLEVIAPAVVGVYRAWSPDGKRMAMGSATDVPVLVDLSRPPGTEAGSFPSRLAPWSWSPDGARIAGNADRPDRSSGIGFFSFSKGGDTILDEDGRGPLWLSDNVRLLYEKQGGIVLFDTRTARAKPILPPGSIATGWAMKFSLSLDDRGIAYLQTQRDGDIWLMDLRPENPERKP